MCRTTFHVYCMVCGIWKHFNVPEPKPKLKPKPAPKPKAAPKPGPKGQHRKVFRMVYRRKKGFTSEPVENQIIPCSLEGTLQPSQVRFSPLVFICLCERRGRAYPCATRRKFFFPQYGAAHGRAQEPTPGSAVEFWGKSVRRNRPLVPRLNIAGSWTRGGGGLATPG